SPGLQGSIDKLHAEAAASTAGFVVGGVGVAAGAVLLATLLAGSKRGPARGPQTGAAHAAPPARAHRAPRRVAVRRAARRIPVTHARPRRIALTAARAIPLLVALVVFGCSQILGADQYAVAPAVCGGVTAFDKDAPTCAACMHKQCCDEETAC